MNLVEFAEQELNNILKTCTDSESLKTQKVINDDILEMVKTFSKQGHSGFSAQYSLSLLKRLLDYKPITSLTGDDNEWIELDYGDDIAYQNNRCPSIFKDKEGKAYNTEGKIFTDDNGHTWFTSKDSRVYIEFPYEVPDKPEWVDVTDNEQRYYIKNKILNFIERITKRKLKYDEIDEDTKLNTLINKDKYVELENELLKFFNIEKPIYSFSKDDEEPEIWNVINIIQKSEINEVKKETDDKIK